MMKSLNIMIILIINMSFMNLLINSIYSNYKMIHPMLMGSILLMFNIMITLNLSLYYNNNWFSFITFLIIIGGLMILFLYFTSFIMNMITSFKLNFLMSMTIKIFTIMLFFIFVMMFMNKYLIWYNNFNEIMSINNMMNLNIFNKNYFIMYMYMYNKNIMSILTILYLLLSLTLIVKMIFMNKITLRKIN